MELLFPADLPDRIAVALGVASLCIWPVIVRVWWRDGSVLPYQPRRPVPWGPIGLGLAGFLLFMQISSRFFGGEAAEPTPQQTVTAVLLWAGIEIALSAAIVVVLVVGYRTTWTDFGLTKRVHDWVADATLGVLAALAALAPVYLVLMVLVRAFGERSQNPLLEELLEDPSGAMFLAAAVAAVLAAPVFEEIVYRLLIQGWLEKILVGRDVVEASEERATRWTPIVISSVLFAAAHFGFEYGYSPIPLLLLALVLGYIYQRTHRILPCIVAHMTFNGTSLLLMWLQIEASKGRPHL